MAKVLLRLFCHSFCQ